MDRNISICNCLKSFSFVGHKLFPKQSCWHHISYDEENSVETAMKTISLFRSAMWKLHITKLLAVHFSLEFRLSIETEMKLSGEYLPVFIQYKNHSFYFNRSTDTKFLYLGLEWSYTPSNWFNETFLCTQKSFGSGTFSGWLNC